MKVRQNLGEFINKVEYRHDAILITKADKPVDELKDINDRAILATLVTSKADYLVTGDQDLLILDKQYPVISPSKFAEFLD
jgi:putative PIN family toxin of toxin-antitoxin system